MTTVGKKMIAACAKELISAEDGDPFEVFAAMGYALQCSILAMEHKENRLWCLNRILEQLNAMKVHEETN
jgi:hypothetical protein